MNGNFLGLGADYACNASVQVDAAQAPGLLFTNGEFTSFHNGDFAPNSTASELRESIDLMLLIQTDTARNFDSLKQPPRKLLWVRTTLAPFSSSPLRSGCVLACDLSAMLIYPLRRLNSLSLLSSVFRDLAPTLRAWEARAPPHSLLVSSMAGTLTRRTHRPFWPRPATSLSRLVEHTHSQDHRHGRERCRLIEADAPFLPHPPLANLQGSTFEQASNQIELQAGVEKALVFGNVFAGAQRITDNAKQSQISMNLFDK